MSFAIFYEPRDLDAWGITGDRFVPPREYATVVVPAGSMVDPAKKTSMRKDGRMDVFDPRIRGVVIEGSVEEFVATFKDTELAREITLNAVEPWK